MRLMHRVTLIVNHSHISHISIMHLDCHLSQPFHIHLHMGAKAVSHAKIEA